MKIIFAVIGILCMGLMSVHANNPLRQSPYPQKDNIIYFEPGSFIGAVEHEAVGLFAVQPLAR